MAFDASQLAAANPYGAAIQAGASVLNNALKDTPTSLTSGSGSFMGGGLTVGNKQVGGKGNQAGATTATATQKPPSAIDSAAEAVGGKNGLYIILGIVVAVFLGAVFMFTRRPSGRRKR